jgi:hypothetical protein
LLLHFILFAIFSLSSIASTFFLIVSSFTLKYP